MLQHTLPEDKVSSFHSDHGDSKSCERARVKFESLTILKGIITLWGKLSELLLFLRWSCCVREGAVSRWTEDARTGSCDAGGAVTTPGPGSTIIRRGKGRRRQTSLPSWRAHYSGNSGSRRAEQVLQAEERHKQGHSSKHALVNFCSDSTRFETRRLFFANFRQCTDMQSKTNHVLTDCRDHWHSATQQHIYHKTTELAKLQHYPHQPQWF